jgi:hypothetical protein
VYLEVLVLLNLLLYASAWSIFYFPGLPTQEIKERHGEQGRKGS